MCWVENPPPGPLPEKFREGGVVPVWKRIDKKNGF